MAAPQRTQKTIEEAGGGSGQQAVAEPQGGEGRRGHPKILPSQEVSRGCW